MATSASKDSASALIRRGLRKSDQKMPSACLTLDDDFREMLEDVWGIEWRRHHAEMLEDVQLQSQ